uniref:Integrin alpha-2 domain-containing protein n=1 Tax=Electrophorus electricus TaxID=8005 RepID=A0A4W4GT25_ELEEL
MGAFGPRRSLEMWILSLLIWTDASAFNLDTHNVLRKTGEPDSLFGFSLAMHRQLQPTDKRILLIGAPRAKALSNQAANITGGLYSCDITTHSDDCDRIEFDNDADVRMENKENQWMGVSVQSQGPGGKIVTCAHRYQRRLFANTPQESRDITGRCYVLSQDLSIDSQSDEDGGNWKFCEGRARGHERFGACQQGLAAAFTRDYHYVIFGAPGAYNWRGVATNSISGMHYLHHQKGQMFYSSEKYFEFLSQGFSLDSGHSITEKGKLIIVSGAPRANHSGAVVLLRKEGEVSTMLSPEHVLQGPGLASSFGYDVAVVDLNGDGWQDIVVGAPQFFQRDGEVGGAVYVYINQAGRWSSVVPTCLSGTKDSMFGLAVRNIGDINLDSYEDIAVGAPYADGGSGKVYIYHGSADGVNTKPAQILEGTHHGVKMFGYSLAGNMDLDGNSYPDLAIGSLSDAVFVYRARPVISIRKEIKVTPKEIDLTKKTCAQEGHAPSWGEEGGEVSFRREFGRSWKPRGRIFVLLPAISYFTSPWNHPSQENIKDKLRAVPIEVSVAIERAQRQKRQSSLPELLPVLDLSAPNRTSTEVNFLKEGCGADNICQSNLQLHCRFCYRETNQDIFPPLPLKNGIAVVSLSDQKDIALEVTVKNRNGDDAHEAKLVGLFGESLSYSGFRSQRTTDKHVICAANQNGSQAECELGNPFKRDSEVTFYIILSTAGISLNTTEVDLLLSVQGYVQLLPPPIASHKYTTARDILELTAVCHGVRVARPSQVYFGGEVRGESAMKSEEEAGSLIEYEFRVINLGKPLKSFGTASLDIQWPRENSVGKWLLYLVKVGSKELEQLTCSPENEINPLGLAEVRHPPCPLLQPPASINSCSGDAGCVEIRCPLLGLDGSADIILRSRLWNSTFLEDYASYNYLDLIVTASISLDVSAKNLVLKNPETQVLTVFPEHTAAQFGGVPWWIILVAVLAGILMLALLVLLLWKCGFFKRSKYEDSIPKYHAVRIRKETRQFTDGNGMFDPFEKKQWMTMWSEKESSS